MKEYNVNRGWLFHIEDEDYKRSGDPQKKDENTTFGFFKAGEASGFAARRYENAAWEPIDLPHDYVIDLPCEPTCRSRNGLKPINDCQFGEEQSALGRAECPTFPIVWYRKHFFMTEEGDFQDAPRSEYKDRNTYAPKNKRFFLRFEGVYRDFTVWVNGVYMDRFLCGYLGVTLDITDQLLFGEDNSIAVRVDCSQYDGWWYDGGGIYRDVKLFVTQEVYCLSENLYIHPTPNGTVLISATINNCGRVNPVTVWLTITHQGRIVCRSERSLTANEETSFVEQLFVENPILWDVDNPQLYALTLYLNGEQEQQLSFGFKDVQFDAEDGFFLNGRSLKLNGVCLHQDFAGVGVALTKELTYYRYKKIKEMGANAVRFVHNPPSPDALDACDRLGILVMNETRMFGSSPEALRQLENLIRRDRNHVSLLMWSIGNEEHTVQNTEWGSRMTRSIKKTIEKLCHAPIITYGANNGGQYEGINSELTVRGINYIRISSKFHPDDYHAKHPRQALYSSEESSVLSTRGCYRNDLANGLVDAYGNNCTPWASTPMGYMKFCMSRSYFCGGFLWTAFDYRGEPSPFGRSIRNPMGNFGLMDLCGFPKDIYYYYRAHWRAEPLLHLLPAWNFKEGEPVRVAAFTNCEEVTLYLNGREISKKQVEPFGIPEWTVPFEAGELKAVGRRGAQELVTVRRTSKTASLRITTEDCGEYVLANIDAIDEYGELSTADSSALSITCENVDILGVGNGDPTAKLREHYSMEKQTQSLPSFVSTQKLPGYRPTEHAPVREERNPLFEDEHRMIWQHLPENKEEYVFTTEFDISENYSFVEFSGILGESRIFLDGREIGTTPAADAFIRKRPYRFAANVLPGHHQLTVKMVAGEGTHTVLENAMLVRYKNPQVVHPLFHGRMLIILRKYKNGHVIIRSETGLTAETTFC